MSWHLRDSPALLSQPFDKTNHNTSISTPGQMLNLPFSISFDPTPPDLKDTSPLLSILNYSHCTLNHNTDPRPPLHPPLSHSSDPPPLRGDML